MKPIRTRVAFANRSPKEGVAEAVVEIARAGLDEASQVFSVEMAGGGIHAVRAWNEALWTEVVDDRGPLPAKRFLRDVKRARPKQSDWFNPFHPRSYPKIIWSEPSHADLRNLQDIADQIALIGDVVHLKTCPPAWTTGASWETAGRPRRVEPECRLTWLPPKRWEKAHTEIYHATPGGGHMPHETELFSWSRREAALAYAAKVSGRPSGLAGRIEVIDRKLADAHDPAGWDVAVTVRSLRGLVGQAAHDVHDIPDDIVRRWLDLRRCRREINAAAPSPALGWRFFDALSDIARRPEMASTFFAGSAASHLVRWREFEDSGVRFAPASLHPADDEALSDLAL